jgi:hypothetical protein
MSKRTTTRWYVAAWVVWVIAVVAMFAMVRGNAGANPPAAGVLVAYLIMAVAGIVMLVMWIGALVKLGMQQAWGWFIALLVLHLFALGIIGMVAYAIAGPEDTEVVIRPTAT